MIQIQKQKIFLPLVYDDTGIYLVGLRSFDRNFRYFTREDDPLLGFFYFYLKIAFEDIRNAGIIKSLPDEVVAESMSVSYTYLLQKVKHVHLLLDEHIYELVRFSKLEDLAAPTIPFEIRIGLLKILENELQ